MSSPQSASPFIIKFSEGALKLLNSPNAPSTPSPVQSTPSFTAGVNPQFAQPLQFPSSSSSVPVPSPAASPVPSTAPITVPPFIESIPLPSNPNPIQNVPSTAPPPPVPNFDISAPAPTTTTMTSSDAVVNREGFSTAAALSNYDEAGVVSSDTNAAAPLVNSTSNSTLGVSSIAAVFLASVVSTIVIVAVGRKFMRRRRQLQDQSSLQEKGLYSFDDTVSLDGYDGATGGASNSVVTGGRLNSRYYDDDAEEMENTTVFKAGSQRTVMPWSSSTAASGTTAGTAARTANRISYPQHQHQGQHRLKSKEEDLTSENDELLAKSSKYSRDTIARRLETAQWGDQQRRLAFISDSEEEEEDSKAIEGPVHKRPSKLLMNKITSAIRSFTTGDKSNNNSGVKTFKRVEQDEKFNRHLKTTSDNSNDTGDDDDDDDDDDDGMEINLPTKYSGTVRQRAGNNIEDQLSLDGFDSFVDSTLPMTTTATRKLSSRGEHEKMAVFVGGGGGGGGEISKKFSFQGDESSFKPDMFELEQVVPKKPLGDLTSGGSKRNSGWYASESIKNISMSSEMIENPILERYLAQDSLLKGPSILNKSNYGHFEEITSDNEVEQERVAVIKRGSTSSYHQQHEQPHDDYADELFEIQCTQEQRYHHHVDDQEEYDLEEITSDEGEEEEEVGTSEEGSDEEEEGGNDEEDDEVAKVLNQRSRYQSSTSHYEQPHRYN